MFIRITKWITALVLVMVSVLSWGQIINPGPTTAGNNGFTGNNTFSLLNNVIYVDGVTYPFTFTGIRNAIAAVNIGGGTGGTVILPDTWNTTLFSGSQFPSDGSTINIPTGVCLVGASRFGTWIQWTSAGALFTFANGVHDACMRNITINMFSGGSTTIGIKINGNNAGSAPVHDLVLDSISFRSSSANAGLIGLNLVGTSGPADIASSVFSNLEFVQVDKPIVANNDEENHWYGIHINTFGVNNTAVSFGANSNNEHGDFLIQGSGTSAVCVSTAGVKNTLDVICDIGSSPNKILNETGNNSFYRVNSSSTPLGTIVSSDIIEGQISGGGVSAFQVFKGANTAYLTSLYTNSTTTFSNVTGLSFPVDVNSSYRVSCDLDYQTSATTADVKIQWTGPASPTFLVYDLVVQVTASTVSNAVNPATATTTGAFSTSIAETGTPTITTNFPLRLTMTLINGATAGTVQLQAAATGVGTISILPGSCVLNQ